MIDFTYFILLDELRQGFTMTDQIAKKWRVILLVFLIASISGCAPTIRPNWYKFRANIANRGLGVDGAQGKPINVIGTFTVMNAPWCPVLWSDRKYKMWTDSRIIVGGPGYVIELSPLNGNRVSGDLPSGLLGGTYNSCASAYPDAGVIYVTDETNNKLQALNDDLSQILWDYTLPYTINPLMGGLPTSPTTYGDLVLVGANTTIFALHNPQSGSNPVWYYDLQQPVAPKSSPALTFETNPAAVIAGYNGKVVKVLVEQSFAVNQQPQVVWTTTVPNNPIITEALAVGVDSAVFVPTKNGIMYALNPETDADLAKSGRARVRWQYDTKTNGYITAPAVLFRRTSVGSVDVVYFADSMGTLYAVNGRSGALEWSSQLPAAPTIAPVVTANEIVYIGVGLNVNATVVAVDHNQQPPVIWHSPPPVGHTIRNLAVAENGAIWATTDANLVRID